jgi:hypothetical protein
MKFLTKILTVAVIAVLGTTVWVSQAQASAVGAVQSAYQTYRTEFSKDPNSDATANALNMLNTRCNNNCRMVRCRTNKALQLMCATICAYDNVEHCVSGLKFRQGKKPIKVHNEKTWLAFLDSALHLQPGAEVDDNDIPMTPLTKAKKKVNTTAAGSVVDKTLSVFGGDDDDDDDDSSSADTDTPISSGSSGSPKTPVNPAAKTAGPSQACIQAGIDNGVSPEDALENGFC